MKIFLEHIRSFAGVKEKKSLFEDGIETLPGPLRPPQTKMMDKILTKEHDLAFSLLEEIQLGDACGSIAYNAAISACIKSVLSDPATRHLLAQMAGKSPALKHHSLSCFVLSTCFGRYLGLTGQLLYNLAQGALLHDVGMLSVDSSIYEKTGDITASEMCQLEAHVLHGPQILANNPKFWEVIDVAHSHHERINGTGYPRQLRGEAIPYNARIVAIVEAYDAMVSNLNHKSQPGSPARAMSTLYRSMGTGFDSRLVESFIRFLGIYPVGSLVEFDSGEVGIVVEEKPFHKMMPKVVLILDNQGNRISPEIVDLYEEKINLKGSGHRSIKALPNNKYNINISSFLKKNNKYHRDR